MKEQYRQIISGSTAALVLGLLSLKTDFVFWFNLLISAAIGLGIYFSIPKKKSPSEIELAPGITKATLDDMLALINSYVKQFDELVSRTRKREIAEAIKGITSLLKKIAFHFNQNPAAIHIAPLLDQYLHQSFEVVQLYTRLANVSIDGKQSEQLQTVEDTIFKIHAGFQEIYDQCIHNELINLEVKSETLKAVMDLNIPGLDIDQKTKQYLQQ